MDASERLTPADLEAPGYLAASHLHRYGLAATLCEGLRVLDLGCGVGYGSALLRRGGATVLGVDVDPEAVAEATSRYADERVAFETGDALERLRTTTSTGTDAVVMFEALEHVPDPEAIVDELARLAADGVRLLVSLPNSKAFAEENAFHVTDYGYEEAHAALERLGDVAWIYQSLSEGSLLLGEAAPTQAELVLERQADPETANTFIAAVGFDHAARVAAGRHEALVAPAHNRYMLELEHANRELERANRLLARGAYGKFDAAAATAEARLDLAREEVREDLDELETRAWILKEERDRFLHERDAARSELEQYKRWTDAGRYHAVDRAVETVRRTPGLAQAGRVTRWLYRRRRRS